MKFGICLVILLIPIAAFARQPTTRPAPVASEDGMSVYFSPRGACIAAAGYQACGTCRP